MSGRALSGQGRPALLRPAAAGRAGEAACRSHATNQNSVSGVCLLCLPACFACLPALPAWPAPCWPPACRPSGVDAHPGRGRCRGAQGRHRPGLRRLQPSQVSRHSHLICRAAICSAALHLQGSLLELRLPASCANLRLALLFPHTTPVSPLWRPAGAAWPGGL